jgi:hypothetical protein
VHHRAPAERHPRSGSPDRWIPDRALHMLHTRIVFAPAPTQPGLERPSRRKQYRLYVV